jgi:DNA-directed RNA polymerase subunit RPC12/RpoP
MYTCLKCSADITYMVNFDTIFTEISCPNCGNKMKVEYDESCDPETGDEESYFWVVNVND